jgi:glutamate synthase domain-containing protein 3
VRRTGSTVGQRVLDELESLLPRFVKVFPTDYKRVLAELATQEAATADEFTAEAVDVVGAPHERLGDGE